MAVSIFARVGTIKGESRDVKHPDEIEVLTWSWGCPSPGRRPPVQEAAQERRVSKTSPSPITSTRPRRP